MSIEGVGANHTTLCDEEKRYELPGFGLDSHRKSLVNAGGKRNTLYFLFQRI